MYDLHYWPTPNGKKVTILLEELGVPYRIVPCNIGMGDQFKPDFLKVGPNNRMPILIDHAPKDGGAPIGDLRVRRDHDVYRGKRGQVLSAGGSPPLRGQPVGDLADGQPGPEVGRVRPFPAARRKVRRPVLRGAALHRRGQPALRRPQQPALRPSLSRGRRVHDRRHDLLSLDRELEGPASGHRGVQIFQALVR